MTHWVVPCLALSSLGAARELVTCCGLPDEEAMGTVRVDFATHHPDFPPILWVMAENQTKIWDGCASIIFDAATGAGADGKHTAQLEVGQAVYDLALAVGHCDWTPASVVARDMGLALDLSAFPMRLQSSISGCRAIARDLDGVATVTLREEDGCMLLPKIMVAEGMVIGKPIVAFGNQSFALPFEPISAFRIRANDCGIRLTRMPERGGALVVIAPEGVDCPWDGRIRDRDVVVSIEGVAVETMSGKQFVDAAFALVRAMEHGKPYRFTAVAPSVKLGPQ